MKVRMTVATALLLTQVSLISLQRCIKVYFQGGVGWWMVKSGLDPTNNSESSVPRVSQYRLATHLSLAFVLYSLFFYNGLGFLVRHNDVSVRFFILNVFYFSSLV